MNIIKQIKLGYQRAFFGIDQEAIEAPDEYTTDFYFFMANTKANWLEQYEDIKNKETLKTFNTLQQIAFGMAGYKEMCSGVYKITDLEYKRLKKEFDVAWKLLGANMTILW